MEHARYKSPVKKPTPWNWGGIRRGWGKRGWISIALGLTALVVGVGAREWVGRVQSLEKLFDQVSSPFGERYLPKRAIARAIVDSGFFQDFPSAIEVNWKNQKALAKLSYAFEPGLQDVIQGLFKSYRPDYAAVTVVDPRTGRVLALESYTRRDLPYGHLALRASFPAASIFKVVTATAAISEHGFTADTEMEFFGRKATLYKSQVFGAGNRRWARQMTLKEAFALSVNSVFAKIGVMILGPGVLEKYAAKFGFNREIPADVPLERSMSEIQNDAWKLAETASGFTQKNTLSPLQGALIAASIINDGKMMEPYAISSAVLMGGEKVYSPEPRLASQVMEPDTAYKLRQLMIQTVQKGTSQKSFRGFFKGPFAQLEVGGKTGTLSGHDPSGKYDWFVGYATDGKRPLAFAVLTINEDQWRVKSAYVARRIIEAYYRHPEEHL